MSFVSINVSLYDFKLLKKLIGIYSFIIFEITHTGVKNIDTKLKRFKCLRTRDNALLIF